MAVKDKLSVAEIRAALVENGYSVDELQGLGKAKLREMLKSAESSEDFLNQVSPQVTDVESKNENPVDMGSPEWTKYVMTLFDTSELDNGMPRVDALRRVAYHILGPSSSRTDVVQVPCLENAGRATVRVSLSFVNTEINVEGAADVFSGNTARDFALHAVATAETRAEGRALRKALMLTKVLSAEELQNADTDEANGTDTRIVASMLTSLKVMSEKLGLDLHKVALSSGYPVESVDDLTHKQGLDIAKELGKFQRKEKEITDAVRK